MLDILRGNAIPYKMGIITVSTSEGFTRIKPKGFKKCLGHNKFPINVNCNDDNIIIIFLKSVLSEHQHAATKMRSANLPI